MEKRTTVTWSLIHSSYWIVFLFYLVGWLLTLHPSRYHSHPSLVCPPLCSGTCGGWTWQYLQVRGQPPFLLQERSLYHLLSQLLEPSYRKYPVKESVPLEGGSFKTATYIFFLVVLEIYRIAFKPIENIIVWPSL